MIEEGQKAPDFTLPDSQGNTVSLHDFSGKENVVLIMYPGDDTPGCTKQLCAVRDNIDDFGKYNTTVLGINHEDSESHNKFIKKYGLKNPLLIDEGRKVIGQYDAIGSFLGHPSTKRSVIVIDKTGAIRKIWRGLPSHQEISAELQKI